MSTKNDGSISIDHSKGLERLNEVLSVLESGFIVTQTHMPQDMRIKLKRDRFSYEFNVSHKFLIQANVSQIAQVVGIQLLNIQERGVNVTPEILKLEGINEQ